MQANRSSSASSRNCGPDLNVYTSCPALSSNTRNTSRTSSSSSITATVLAFSRSIRPDSFIAGPVQARILRKVPGSWRRIKTESAGSLAIVPVLPYVSLGRGPSLMQTGKRCAVRTPPSQEGTPFGDLIAGQRPSPTSQDGSLRKMFGPDVMAPIRARHASAGARNGADSNSGTKQSCPGHTRV